MSDRNLSGSKPKIRLTVPPPVWSAIDIVVAVGLTAAITLVVVVVNSFLLGKGTYRQGFDAWLSFIQRPDILGTMVMTALVTVLYLLWRRGPKSRF